jgi:serine/threonine protein kinase
VIQQVGRYLVFEEFARGGMATVHLARLDGSAGFRRILAVKRMRSEPAQIDLRAAIHDEAMITSRIVHRNVVQLLDVIEDGGDLYLVMEYVHGLALSVLLREARRRGEPAPPRVATAIVADALEGLQAAHDATDAAGHPLNIVHRDMSPQNVIVGADGVARVLDFGIAKASVQRQQTTPGTLKGKVAYMAPEQIHGRAGPASDVYSTGLILYEALGGTRAIGSFETEAEALAAILVGNIRPLVELRPDLSPELLTIAAKAIARDPEHRFGSARLLAEFLREWGVAPPDEVARWVASLGGELLQRRQELVRKAESSLAAPGGPRRVGVRWAVAGVVVAALAVGGGWSLSQRRPPEPSGPVPPVLAPDAAAAPEVVPPPQVPAAAPDAAVVLPSPAPDAGAQPAAGSDATHPHRPARPARPPAKDCDPPYRIDKNGHKQFKPECF